MYEYYFKSGKFRVYLFKTKTVLSYAVSRMSNILEYFQTTRY